MTVQTNTNSIAYVGNGSTVHYDYDFLILDDGHLKVYFGDVLQVSGYVVSGVGSQSGGTVAFSAAPPNLTNITLTRDVPFLQLTDYQPYDAFPADSHERALDLLTMMAQQLKDASDRSMQYPVGGNKWDAKGNEITNVGTGSADTSAPNIGQVKQLIADLAGPDSAAQLRLDLLGDDGTTLVATRRPGAETSNNLINRKFLTVRHCSDWDIRCDGTDETAKLIKMRNDINAIPNPNGLPVKLVFSGQSDTLECKLTFNNTINFTRPVHMDGSREVYINYLGASDAFILGPTELTGDLTLPAGSNVHKYYSVEGFGATGGTTSGRCFYFRDWILYPTVKYCRFEAFGGNGSWAVYCQSNNWSVLVKDCECWLKTNSHDDDANKRNFVGCPGATVAGVRDEFATRLNAIDNWVYSGGYTSGGTAYLVSGWKSRIIGGGVEGPRKGVIIARGCKDIELSFYWESLFGDLVVPPSVIQLGYSGDPYAGAYDSVERLNIHDMYCNMHNTDALASNGRFLLCDGNVKVKNISMSELTMVHSGYPLLELPDIAGHSVAKADCIMHDGNIGPDTYMLTTKYAGVHKPAFLRKVKNYCAFPDFSAIVTGATGPFPVNSNLGASGIFVSADGTGGSLTATKTATDNTAGSGYERHKLFQQLNFGYFAKTSAPSGNTFFMVALDLSAKLMDFQGGPITVFSVMKATDAPVTVRMNHMFASAGVRTQCLADQLVQTGDWLGYSFRFNIPELAPGVTSTDSQKLEIVLPSGATLFKLGVAAVDLVVGEHAVPLNATI